MKVSMNLVTVCLSISFLSNCSIQTGRYPSNLSEIIDFKLELIHVLSRKPTDLDKHPVKLPYIAKYIFGEKNLYYLVTAHSRDITSATHRTIKKMLQKHEDLNVVVEMNIKNKAQLSGQLERCNIYKACVEASYAYKLANAKDFDIFGGEPFNRVVKKHFLGRGYSIDELIFFYTVRNFSQWHPYPPKPPYRPKYPKKEIESIIEHKKRSLEQTDNSFSYNTLVELYKRGMGREFNYENVKYSDIAPYKDGHYIQKLSVVVDEAREISVLRAIQDAINIDDDNTFVIYGSGHYLKHRQVLNQALGNPNYIKLH